MNTGVIQVLPTHVDQALRYLDRRQPNRAFTILRDFLSKNMESAYGRSLFGRLMTEMGKPSAGLEHAQKALTLGEPDAFIMENLARCYLAAGDRKKAVAAIRRGLRIGPRHFSNRLVTFYHNVGMRRRPVISTLHREHPINRVLGRLSWHLGRKGP